MNRTKKELYRSEAIKDRFSDKQACKLENEFRLLLNFYLPKCGFKGMLTLEEIGVCILLRY